MSSELHEPRQRYEDHGNKPEKYPTILTGLGMWSRTKWRESNSAPTDTPISM